MNRQHRQSETSMSDGHWMEVPIHRSIASEDLLAGEQVIVITHGNDEYRLRLTASGKLLLTR